MVTYILLVTLTEHGRQNFKTSYTTTRDEFKNQVAKLGGKITGYVTAGPYDAIEIIDMPNDDGALAILLGSLSVSEIRTVTLRAFHEDQVKKTLQQMS
ncbi:MAG: GYD domain-containing protein [Nitrososphaera sp.]